MSDMIEEYLKNVIRDQGRIEIKRHELADLFDCVPSQINYVINTRFTMQHGYAVESKRGGGGYIRIIKMQIQNDTELLDRMSQIIGQSVSEKEAQIMLAAIDQTNLTGTRTVDKQLRANILISMIRLLILKNK